MLIDTVGKPLRRLSQLLRDKLRSIIMMITLVAVSLYQWSVPARSGRAEVIWIAAPGSSHPGRSLRSHLVVGLLSALRLGEASKISALDRMNVSRPRISCDLAYSF